MNLSLQCFKQFLNWYSSWFKARRKMRQNSLPFEKNHYFCALENQFISL